MNQLLVGVIARVLEQTSDVAVFSGLNTLINMKFIVSILQAKF